MNTIYKIFPEHIEMVSTVHAAPTPASTIKVEKTLVFQSYDEMLFILHNLKTDFLLHSCRIAYSNAARYRNILFALDNLIDIVRTTDICQAYVIKMLVSLLSFLNRLSFKTFEIQIFNKHE